LLLEEKEPLCWLSLVKPGKRFKPGTRLYFPGQGAINEGALPQLTATVRDRDEKTGGRWLQFELPTGFSFWDLIDQLGQIPFPPYVTDSQALPEQYQTIYADQPGAVAAPTAGLHFTESLFEQLAEQGIQTCYVTLHVGIGTFRPVEVEAITQHQMHQEWIDVPAETVDKIHQTQAAGGRVIAVGTTSVRSLEGAAKIAQEKGSDRLLPYQGKTDLFIYPGYSWQVIDGMITNFHLPKSSLLMMLSALIGRERLLRLYEIAIADHYRFYSFGDAMLILPSAWKA
jgi:S-adenosylmethionine:tRNA ribosyltransferase-isomerase